MRGGEMKSQQPSVLALTALLLCTLHQAAAAAAAAAAAGSGRSHRSRSASSTLSSTASTAEVTRGRDTVATLHGGLKHTNITNNYKSRPPPKLEAAPGHMNSFSSNTSTGNNTTVTSDKSGRTPSWSSEEEESSSSSSSHCAYRVFEGGIGGQLCFRNTLFGYKCSKADCRTVVSLGNLVANLLINGSVLLQWSHEGESVMANHGVKTVETAAGQKSRGDAGTNAEETLGSNTVFSGPRHKRGGYELSCLWNGSYTQFECAGVHLGSSCRDFLLTELHENIPYRLCLRSLAHSDLAQRADQRDCVEFTLPLSGMQDIVIAMTTVGGAICVMLVIICLLVAYITENIMSPTTQHSYSYRTHSCH